jgi:hypothetical protein
MKRLDDQSDLKALPVEIQTKLQSHIKNIMNKNQDHDQDEGNPLTLFMADEKNERQSKDQNLLSKIKIVSQKTTKLNSAI